MLPKQPIFTLPIHLLYFILLLYSLVFSCEQVCNHQDQSTLLAFSSNISTPNSLPLNWSSSTSCCQWEGIKCDVNGRVTHLQLCSRGLDGVISSSINDLIMLTHLNLSNNSLHGPLPEEILWLTNLRVIDLSSNSLLGSIPREISNLSSLQKLHFYQNNLSGPLPPSLMNCTLLEEILLRDNYLSGDISKLDFSRLTRLQKLDLRNNSLVGTLPESIYSCKSLVALGVARNILSGQISPKISDLKSLSFLSLVQNSFSNISGTLRVLAKCKNLTSLFLSVNFYGEFLPVHKHFIGLGEFPKLQLLSLRNCKFEPGIIPNWLSSLKNLCYLSLEGDRIVGKVPNWLGRLPNLSRILLKNNSLVGELPLNLCQLPALASQNMLADSDVSQFELPVIIVFKGDVSSYIRFKTDYYHGIDLSYNAFSGNIPEEIGNLRNLQELELNNNHFSGHIPTSLSNLKNLEVLNVSRNNLSGEIPTLLGRLSFLSHFDVSYNDLKGPIPTSGQFGTFQESSFEGNPGLCGEPLNTSCSVPTTSKVIDRNESHHNLQQFLDGLIAGFASGFLSTLLVVASCALSTCI